MVYCYEGAITVAGEALGRRRLGVLGDGDGVALTADDDGARVLLIAGRPFGEPIVRYGPFVMNSEQEIRDAISDFRAGRF